MKNERKIRDKLYEH